MPTSRCLQSFVLLALMLVYLPAIILASDSLEGTWQHMEDSPSGWHVLTGGSATLTLSANGQANLSATGPNQNPLNQTGTWSQQGGRVTINISGEVEVSNKSFQLQGDTLTLPTQLSSDDPGTSTWMRVKSEGIDLIFVAFNRGLEKGESATQAAEEAATEARKEEGVEDAKVNPGGTGLVLTLKPEAPAKGGAPAAGKMRASIWFANKSAPRNPPVQRKPTMSPLAADPRTHIDAQNPPGDPDAPKTKTALVVAPFHSKVYYAYDQALWHEGGGGAGGGAPIARTTTFKELGDDPEGIAKKLENVGYDVKLLIDGQATPGAVFRALQSRPTVIYFATHGGLGSTPTVEDVNAVAVAGFLGVDTTSKQKGFLTPALARSRLADLLAKDNVPEAARSKEAVAFSCLQEGENMSYCFPLLLPKFFELALGEHGAPNSFAFIDACYSGTYPIMAKTINPKVFMGYTDTMEGWASARFAKYLFCNLEHRGHSVGEAWDRLLHLTEGAYVVYLEDSILSPVAQGNVDLKKEGAKVQLWGIDHMHYHRINNEVFWLMRMARWASQDINNGANTLGRCYDQYWKLNKRPGLADQFCNSGILGDHTPTEEEVELARHLVSGKPTKPLGRFVLR
ncbi:MAG: lipocalin family protein [Terriglobia bacterium]